MKKARIINAIVWIAVAVAICIMVAIQWHAKGCGPKSLVIACAMYTAMAVGIAGTIDQTLKEISK